jgi:hypothetical protein
MLCVLVLVACGQQQGMPTAQRGTTGVDVSFVDDAPPLQVYEDTTFPVTVRVTNTGAHDVPFRIDDYDSPKGILRVNTDDFYLGVDAVEDTTFELRGRSETIPQGEERLVKVADLTANTVSGQRESPSTQVFVSACYPYVTELSTDICMDGSSAQRNLREQVCSSRDHSYSGGQGAPVAVSRVEVDMYPSGQYTRPSFAIHVSNTGRGTVLRALPRDDAEIGELCALRGERESVNTVDVEARIADVELECNPDPVRLQGDTGTVFCEPTNEALQDNPNLFIRKDNFETTLYVKLWYLYSIGESRTVEIQRKNIQGGERPSQPSSGPSCQEEMGDGFSCSCNYDQCVELGKDRCNFNNDALCSPGTFCCQTFACEEVDDEQQCRNEERCSWNNETEVCVSS